MNSAPWTEIGRCQQDIQFIKNELRRKADSCEIHEINRKLDSMEHTMREIGTTLDGILFRIQTCEDQIAVFADSAKGGA